MISPEIMAWAVWSDTVAWLGAKLPKSMIQDLVTWAETLFALNPKFRRRIQTRGKAGRDRLLAFMRHWFCALVGDYDRELAARLPSSYAWGEPLPERPLGSTNQPRGKPMTSRGNAIAIKRPGVN